MNKWCKQAPKEDVKDFIVTALQKKLQAKGITAGPPSTYLQTSNLPDIDLCKEVFGSYKDTCKQLQMKPMLSKALPKQFKRLFKYADSNRYKRTKATAFQQF